MTTNLPTNVDQVLRHYLLGTSSPETRDDIEQRLFSDDRIFWERLSLVEDQLVDDCAWGRLGTADRESFDRNFLTTSERRAKLEFACALRAYVEPRKEASSRVWQWLRGPIAAPGWAVAGAAVLLLAVLPGLAWRFAATPAPQGIVVSTWLAPGQIRDIGQELARVKIGPDCQLVRFPLETVPAKYGGYSATLFDVTADEIQVWSQHRLSAAKVEGRLAVTLTLPCGLLSEGDYYVRLQGTSPGTDPVTLGKYNFRVLRR